MDKRIFGLETEYGVTCAATDGRGLSADEVARYLFRKVSRGGGARRTSSCATARACTSTWARTPSTRPRSATTCVSS